LFQSLSLTFEQINDLRIAFSLLNKDNDGSISINDLGTLLNSLGYNVTDNMIDEFNSFGNGTINFEEFLKLIADDCDFEDDDTQLFDAFKLFGNFNIDFNKFSFKNFYY
jgi:calmodulin